MNFQVNTLFALVASIIDFVYSCNLMWQSTNFELLLILVHEILEGSYSFLLKHLSPILWMMNNQSTGQNYYRKVQFYHILHVEQKN